MKQPTAHPLLALACLSIAAAWMPAKAQSLQYIGQQIVPSGTQYLGTTVGGLSGLDFVASSGRYVAISDDRSGFNPARFYELTLDLAQFARSANPGQAGVGFQSVTTILDPAGLPFATNTLDPEGIEPVDTVARHRATGSTPCLAAISGTIPSSSRVNRATTPCFAESFDRRTSGVAPIVSRMLS